MAHSPIQSHFKKKTSSYSEQKDVAIKSKKKVQLRLESPAWFFTKRIFLKFLAHCGHRAPECRWKSFPITRCYLIECNNASMDFLFTSKTQMSSFQLEHWIEITGPIISMALEDLVSTEIENTIKSEIKDGSEGIPFI